MTETETNPQAAPDTPEIVLQQIYLKDCSYEAPNGPRIPSAQWNPKFSLNLNTASTELGAELREVVLTVTIEAKVGDSVAYLVELKQAGVFMVRYCSEGELKTVVGADWNMNLRESVNRPAKIITSLSLFFSFSERSIVSRSKFRYSC